MSGRYRVPTDSDLAWTLLHALFVLVLLGAGGWGVVKVVALVAATVACSADAPWYRCVLGGPLP